MPEKAQAEEETLKEISISDLRENDVVLLDRPVPENGGTLHRYYFGRVVDPKKYKLLTRRFAKNDIVICISWHLLQRENKSEERLNSHLIFDKNEEYVLALVLGKWNPETLKVESLEEGEG